ncbi:caspase family protein [Hymenobacter perfusus]|uniref:Peptidase C14 caspase domain-containing protein n=1 Tax=Hymenobacter perfusus TaxID=1236770 RepID=A0A3R9MQV4_9BACT|nr:caspase family protein [Hymenobacter perfusus]RSK38456.1 hypothetical protein EI293_21805 [Hymenobacter perfusus]
MAKRAAICIGVNRAEGMTPLMAATKGARDFADWATAQGCDVTLLVDEGSDEVESVRIFKAVRAVVEAGIYEQLLLYFSGHGVLLAPGAEYWLLSGAPQNPNEAVNLLRSVEDARNAGIPHVIFISDACRSAGLSAPLNGVVGGSIFPNRAMGPQSGEVDVFFATRPGDPAWEVPEAEATPRYRGLFTDCLLKALQVPGSALAENLPGSAPVQSIITSRSLKPYLEKQVPLDAAAVNIQLNQQPQVRVETASPKFFAVALPPLSGTASPAYRHEFKYIFRASRGMKGQGSFSGPAAGSSFHLQSADVADEVAAVKFAREVARLRGHPDRLPPETETGFMLVGIASEIIVAPGWEIDRPTGRNQDPEAEYFRFRRPARVVGEELPSATALLQFRSGTGTLLAILPGFIGVVTVAESRVLNVNYMPAPSAARYRAYEAGASEREELKARAAVRSRHGEFDPTTSLPALLEARDGFDPTLGLYLAYGYAQRGKQQEVLTVRHRLAHDQSLPLLFDIELLTSRYQAAPAAAEAAPIVPQTPLLAQGWALLTPDNPLYQPLHGRLRPHLLPALWTTYTAEGVAIALAALSPPENP